MRTQRMSRWTASVALVVALVVSGGLARAVIIPITPTDLDGIALGGSVGSSGPVNITSSVGTLYVEAFYNSGAGLYTYVLDIGVSKDDAREVLTPASLDGLNNVAGWSYTEAAAAGGLGDASDWAIDLLGTGALRWDTPTQESGSHFLGTGESLRFFYQSAHAVAPTNLFYILAVDSGGAPSSGVGAGLTPDQTPPPVVTIPEPARLGLIGLAILGLRRKRS